MKFELKKISYSEALSQETSAYAAVVYVDGKKQFSVSNSGHGGCDMQHAIGTMTVKEADDWLKKNRPPYTSGDFAIEHDLEMECMTLI